jgi:hypothetical protein
LSHPIGQKEVDRDAQPTEGQVPTARSLRNLTGKKMLLSAAVTPIAATNGKANTSPVWDSLSETLGVFTAARYSRNGGVDGTALDSALSDAQDAVSRLRISQWRRFGRSRRPAESETTRQTWAR